MIGPMLPAVDPWTDGGDQGTAAWRERERRQRTVRLLMMFLLMLLLMDGEEHQARQRRDHFMKATSPKPLEEHVYQARIAQDDRIHKVTRAHERYKALVEKNGDNVESQVRKWAELQQELEQDGFDVKARVMEDPDKEKPVFHYPWNATGFYRGEWVRESASTEELEEKEAKGEKAIENEKNVYAEEKAVDTDESAKAKMLSPAQLEGPMEELLKERNEHIGVFLLPKGISVDMGNFTELKTETAAAQAAVQNLRAPVKRAPGSPFLRLGNPELEEDFEEEADTTPQVTLTKPSGRAAFQFSSRSIPAMKELSLVDGFVKLYDSNTVGYSTRRDILLRVRGVMIHSIGRLSLVSNAPPGRSAFVVLDEKHKKDDREKRRRLEESVMALDSLDIENEHVERIRDNVLALYPLNSMSEKLGKEEGGWQLTSFDFDESDFEERNEKDLFRGIVSDLQSTQKRRLSEAFKVNTIDLNIEMSEDSEIPEFSEDPEDSGSLPRTLSRTVHGNTKVEKTPRSVANPKGDIAERPTRSLAKAEGDVTHPKDVFLPSSRIVVPYPFVPDDERESIRKAKTPLSRRMPPREQLLEVNAGRCEFEINLDVSDIEWTLGQWRTMMSRLVRETNMLDPSSLKKEVDESDKEDEEETVKAAHTMAAHTGHTIATRKHAPSPAVRTELRSRSKPIQNQALVMTMLGSIHSPNCEFTSTLNATAIRTDWEHTTGKAINYSFYMMLACLVQIVVLLRQLLHTQSQSAATRVSLLSVGWQTVVDALVCLAHIYLSLAMQPLFTAFASVAFFKLLIFCVIEMKYMAIIIQARNNAEGGQNTTEILRRQVAMLHLRFYVALVGSFLAFFWAGSDYRTIYILALYSFWVPQIVLNVITEAKRPLHHYYIYGMSLTRLISPLYIFAVPNNFLKEVYPDAPTNLFMCELLVLWVGIQTAVLIAQGKYGARFMIPARFLPPKFDYSRPIPPSMLPEDALELPLSDNERSSEVQTLLPSDGSAPDRHSSVTRNRIKGSRAVTRAESMTTEPVQGVESHGLDCVICYNGIDIHNRRGYMLAPCNHIFHRDCLVQWMDVKMECPICRTELPSL